MTSPIVFKLDYQSSLELSIAASVLFDEYGQPLRNTPGTVIALCDENPTLDTMLPTAVSVCSRLLEDVILRNGGDAKEGIDILVDGVFTRVFGFEGDELVRPRELMNAIYNSKTTDSELTLSTSGFVSDLSLVVRFVLALSFALARNSDLVDYGYPILEASGHAENG